MACQPRREFADAKSVAQLAEPLRSRIAQAIADAPHGGLVLVSGKRTDYQQWLLWSSRCPKLTNCGQTCKGPPTTAAPGKSHHRNTDATHCAADMGGRDLDWLGRNEARYGLHRPVRGEKWHFEPHGTPTVHITPYGQSTPPAPAPAPHEGFPMALTDQQQQELYDRVMAIDLRTVAIHHETTDGANPNLTGISSRQIASLTRLEKAMAAVQVTLATLKPR